MPSSSISRVTRLGIMLLDHFFMCLIMMIPMIPLLLYNVFSSLDAGPGEVPEMFDGPFAYFFALGFALYICKDCIDGRSIAKRIAKLQVVSNRSGGPASAFQCLIRNLFIVIWPIEVIVSLFNPHRRIGDRLVGTKLVVYERGSDYPKAKPLLVVAAVATAFVGCLFIISMLPVPVHVGVKPAGENVAAARALQKQLEDNIFHKVLFEVKVFDSTDHKLATYVWVKGNLQKNYLADKRGGDLLIEKIETQIDSVFNKNSYRGTLQLRYANGASVHMTSKLIGH